MTYDDQTSRIILPDAPAEQRSLLDAGGVACWSEPLTIDTYEPGEPDPYPLFLDRRVYQGSSGKVYPLPMIDSIAHEKNPRQWQAIHLENEYLRLVLLPEIGGRIHIGYDKVAGYDFFYRNNVIKPALVGLAGPWISGGVEFNWPQHHRPATFLPVDTRIEHEDDGAVTVWHSDLDPLQRMRGLHGIRIRPGSTLIEARVELHNRTDVAQTFLWWANVAARVHDEYQSFFPDDVGYVADHARRAITAFPRADRPYYGVDYPALAGQREDADRIDVYSNIPVPTSYMITDTEESFFGGYDHAADAGFVHWADKAIAPGKKQWTWGDGSIGRAWDDQLTDGDGPYVELMAGVYTDNQPDFSWLLPGETKRFSQFWYPIHAVGPARQATAEAAIAVAAEGASLRIGVLTTRLRQNVAVEARRGGEVLGRWLSDIGPSEPLITQLDTDREEGLSIVVRSESGEALAEWAAQPVVAGEPWVAEAPEAPEDIASSDELYTTATHLLQYRHPSRSALPYLAEALERDPHDSRAATALAAWQLRRGQYAEALISIERAVERLTRRNLNPRDGESHYLLGLIQERLGDLTAADRAFAKAAWNAAWQAPASLARARIALGAGRMAAAAALAREAHTIPEARRLEVFALGLDAEDRQRAIAALLEEDPLDPATRALAGLTPLGDARTPLDIGAEFARAGLLEAALAVTEAGDTSSSPAGLSGPIRCYLRALWLDRAGRDVEAATERRLARELPLALAFPAGLDHFDALRAAVEAEPGDHVAAGLLGMWLLDADRTKEALIELRRATDSGSREPVVWRNLALAAVAAEDDTALADSALTHALELSGDGRLLYERDVLAERCGATPEERLARLERHAPLLGHRDDLAVRHVMLLLDTGRVDDAWEILSHRNFRPFEGGEGRVIEAFDRAACARAEALIDTDPLRAATLLEEGMIVPANLGEGRHPAERAVRRWVLLGRARAATGDREGARAAWTAAIAPSPLAVDGRLADEREFWAGVAHLHLDDGASAAARWDRLEARAEALRASPDAVDYFATSLPELALFHADTGETRLRAAAVLAGLASEGRAMQERMAS